MPSATVESIEQWLIEWIRSAANYDFYSLDTDEQAENLDDLNERLIELGRHGHQAKSALYLVSLLIIAFLENDVELARILTEAYKVIVQITPNADSESLDLIQNADSRAAGIRELEKWGQSAIPLLMVLHLYLQDYDDSVNQIARSSADELAGEDKKLLADPVLSLASLMLVDELEQDWSIRQRLAETLGELAVADQSALQILVRVSAADSDEDVRAAATAAVDKIAENDEQIERALLDLLNQDLAQADAVVILNAWSARFPNLISKAQVKSREILIQLALQGDPDVRLQANVELEKVLEEEGGDLSTAYAEAAEGLLDPEITDSWEIRERIAKKLGELEIADPLVLQLLVRVAATDSDEDVRAAATAAAEKIAENDEQIEKALLDLFDQELTQADAVAILNAWSARFPNLISKSPVKSKEILLQLALQGDPDIRLHANAKLEKVLEDEGGDLSSAYVEAAERLLDPAITYDWEARQAMARTLGELSGSENVDTEKIRELLTSAADPLREDDTDVRQSAVTALAKFVGDEASFASYARLALQSDNEEVSREIDKTALAVFPADIAAQKLSEFYVQSAASILDPGKTDSWQARQAMARKLGKLSELDNEQKKTIRDLLTRSADPEFEFDDDVRLSAVKALGESVNDSASLRLFVKTSLQFDSDEIAKQREKEAKKIFKKTSAANTLTRIYAELAVEFYEMKHDSVASGLALELVKQMKKKEFAPDAIQPNDRKFVRMLLARYVLEGAIEEPEMGFDSLWEESREATKQKANLYIQLASEYLIYPEREASWEIRRRSARQLGDLENLDVEQSSRVLHLLIQASSEAIEDDSDVRQSALEAIGSIADCLKENAGNAEKATLHLLAVSRNENEDETLRLSAESVIAKILNQLKFQDSVRWATTHLEDKIRYATQMSLVRPGGSGRGAETAKRLLDELRAKSVEPGATEPSSGYGGIGPSQRAVQVAILIRMINELTRVRIEAPNDGLAELTGELVEDGDHDWNEEALTIVADASRIWESDWEKAVIGANMVMVSQALSMAWERQESDGKSFLVDSVIAALDVDERHVAVKAYHDTRESDIRQNAVLWLGRQEQALYRFDKTRHANVSEELRSRTSRTRPQAEGQEELRNTVRIVSQMFRRTIEATEETKLRSAVKTRGAATEGIELDAAIHRLVEKSDWKSLRPLVKAWARWIVLDDKFWGIAEAEEEMRREPKAVLPLIEQLRRPLQLADVEMNVRDVAGGPGENGEATNADLSVKIATDNRTTFFELIAPSEYARVLQKVWLSDKLDEHEEANLRTLTEDERSKLQRWLAAREWDDEQLTALQKSKIERARIDSAALPESEVDQASPWPQSMQFEELTDEDLHKIIELISLETLRKREMIVHRHITGLLATMSHPWYLIRSGDRPSPEETEKIADMKTELRRHAVRFFASRLRTESNLDIRENMARTLANLSDTESGQSAIDVLVQAVVGEERRQDRRQELLSDYYLEPSKQRSEEAARILKEAIEQAKQTLSTLRRLNQHVFYVGLAVFITGFAVAVFSTTLSTQALGVLAGLGGLVGVLRHMVKDPMDRIQNAMGNLVQMEAAFTSFMWELNLNQTFIQSRYVANGHLTQDEIQTTVDRVENGMRVTMGLVETYAETSSPRIVTRIHKIAPVTADVTKRGQEVTVHGRYLLGDSVDKKETDGTIAINHVPIDVRARWSDDKVVFRLGQDDLESLPGYINGQMPESVLVSLFVDGMETNALPVRLIRRGQGAQSAGHLPGAAVPAGDGAQSET